MIPPADHPLHASGQLEQLLAEETIGHPLSGLLPG
jgi:hypothetical protein